MSDFTATDYSRSSSWLAVPEKKEHEADALFFYPTCYQPESADAPLISTIGDPQVNARAQRCLKFDVSVFSEAADIYVPHYRQCNVFGMKGCSTEEITKVYQGIPCADVFASLDYYFAHSDSSRPFIIAGHSQGSVMVLFALAYYFSKHPEYYKRMIAAYCVGFGLSAEVLKQLPHVKAACGAYDTGCVISYNTEGPGNDAGGKPSLVVPAGCTAINPLNWRTDDAYAPLEMNKGSLHINEDDTCFLGEPLADAQICLERGTVICSSLKNPEKYYSRHVSSFGPKSFHSFDYRFYYANLRDNACSRAKAFISKRS